MVNLTFMFFHFLNVVPAGSSFILTVFLHPKFPSEALAVVCGKN